MAKELELKYGCNPNQKPSRIFMKDGGELPIEVFNGKPGYINFLDAFNSWQLVKELKEATGLPAAASFKHVSPAGAAVGTALDRRIARRFTLLTIWQLSPLACAYARARGADRMCSYGDWIALSDTLRRRHCESDRPGKCPTASSPPATRTRRWKFSKPSARAPTTSSKSIRTMCLPKSSTRRFSASPLSRAATT